MKKFTLQITNRAPFEQAFTLIEMIVVVAIIAILAMTAVPSTIDSFVRAQVKESLALADVAKRGVNTVYDTTGEIAPSNSAAGVPDANKIISNFVSNVTIANGAITLTYGNNAYSSLKGKRITLRPAIVADSPAVPIAWVCAAKKVPDGMTVKGQNLTDLKPNWLPLGCA